MFLFFKKGLSRFLRGGRFLFQFAEMFLSHRRCRIVVETTIYLFPSAGIAFHLTLRSLSLFLPRNSAPGSAPVSYHVAKKLVFKKVRKALGLDRCTKCYTGAAPITKDTLEFFLSLNIPLCELYGMSESSGPHTISRHDAFKLTRYIFLFALV